MVSKLKEARVANQAQVVGIKVEDKRKVLAPLGDPQKKKMNEADLHQEGVEVTNTFQFFNH